MYCFNVDELKNELNKKHKFDEEKEEIIDLVGDCFLSDDTDDELD